MTRRFAAACALALSALITAGPAAAHPHVFIDSKITFVFEAGKVTALRLNWVFDDLFSGDLLSQFDSDEDGAFDAFEAKDVGVTTLPNLKSFHYFTYIWVDGKQLDPIDPADFVASVDDRIVTFQMKVPLPQPVDPRTQALAVENYDSEFFVSVELAKDDPVALENADGVPCGATLRDDTENAYYGGFVIPQEIALQCH